MNGFRNIIAAVLVLATLTGCDNWASPKAVVENAKAQLYKNDVKDFQLTLVGGAAKEFSDPTAILALQNYIANYKDATIGDATLLSAERLSDGDEISRWTIILMDASNPVLQAGIVCRGHTGFSSVDPTDADAEAPVPVLAKINPDDFPDFRLGLGNSDLPNWWRKCLISSITR